MNILPAISTGGAHACLWGVVDAGLVMRPETALRAPHHRVESLHAEPAAISWRCTAHAPNFWGFGAIHIRRLPKGGSRQLHLVKLSPRHPTPLGRACQKMCPRQIATCQREAPRPEWCHAPAPSVAMQNRSTRRAMSAHSIPRRAKFARPQSVCAIAGTRCARSTGVSIAQSRIPVACCNSKLRS